MCIGTCAYVYMNVCVWIYKRDWEIKVKEGIGDEKMAGKEKENYGRWMCMAKTYDALKIHCF